jgi:salicylate hydroxylase
MEGKRYETKAWHAYFRCIAVNHTVQNNAALFYEDSQYKNEQFEVIDPTFIHNNLHVNQFQSYADGITDECVLKIRRHKKTLGPFSRDLKRLATNLALIAYFQGFNSIEMIEILNIFIQQYIKSVLSINNNFKRQNSIDNDQLCQKKPFRFEKQHSANKSIKVQHEMYEINWQSIDSVKKLMILAEQLATTAADRHCQLTINVFSMTTKDVMMMNNVNCSSQTIQSILSSIVQQQLIDEIRLFAMIYFEIVERDHRLFFKNFLINPQIQHTLVNTRSVSILIVGGGIAGMATALSFARAGIRVTLIEKNAEFREVGAGMQLAPNCSRILDQLGILEKVQANAVYPKEIVCMDALSGKRLTCIDLGKKFIETFRYPYIVVHRADLLNVLHQACLETSLVTVETNRFVTNVDERPKSIMIECADGMHYDCKMVIAADGLWSTLRKFVYDDGPPISVGYVAYRGTVQIEQVSKKAGLDNVQMWVGPNMHLVQYPIRRGELFNQVAVFKSNQIQDETDQWGTKEELNEKFSIGCLHVQSSLKALQTNFRWPLYEFV